ncbi:DUF6683 family protein [Deinococcus hopiensis]|uniref:Uncharacterized protein n=1 Tax=Deinococcus hopiensis KR-140 TaxID=695939 RepID=A0A1W1UBS2_9DEIO|nr:DUF6683 family protein [Deinococcus hopiensis]SMB78244.1 hypothetical protein SAMN00790413_06569 [Deinococcus hopiensis KR-140]
MPHHRFARPIRTLFTFALLGAAPLITAPAVAQTASPLSAVTGNAVLGALRGQLTRAAPAAGTGMTLALSAFKPSAGRLLPARLTAGMTSMSPAQQREARSLYEQLLQGYDTLLDQNREGRLKNNVAGALMYALTVSHLVLSGETLSGAQQEALLGSVNAALGRTTPFKTLPDARRQELYEALILTANFALALREGAGEHPAYDAEAKAIAAGLFRQVLGRDPDQTEFTDAGLKFR